MPSGKAEMEVEAVVVGFSGFMQPDFALPELDNNVVAAAVVQDLFLCSLVMIICMASPKCGFQFTHSKRLEKLVIVNPSFHQSSSLMA